jgi:UPF0176 protein
MSQVFIMTAFYKFQTMDNPHSFCALLQSFAEKLGARGLILVSEEGINGTACLKEEQLAEFENFVSSHFADIAFKHSPGKANAFLKMKVKYRPEIVTMGTPELVPLDPQGHLSPKEWQEKLLTAQVLDVRNRYEVEIGKFQNAKSLDIDDFSEFPERLKASAMDKNQPTLIYCTGGIRCEKAILEMQRQGFTNVSQLNGGILKYLEEFGSQGRFDGECFVFDYRVAVDTELQPTARYRLCPHCGQPTDHRIDCRLCGQNRHVCESCLQIDEHHTTCSKNCAHHSRENHRSRKRHADGLHLNRN